jgi:hypothetical protein
MSRQDTNTPRVRGPLRSEPSRSDPSHTAPYSWTSIPQLQATRFPLGMLPRIAYHSSCSYQQTILHTPRPPAPRLYIPYTPDTYPQNTTLQAPHRTRTVVAAESLTTTSKQASHEGDLDVLHWCALDSLPLCQIICYSAIDSNHESRTPAEFLTTRQQLTGRTRVRFAGSQKAWVRSSLRVSTRPRSASSSRRTPRWKRGHRRTTTKAY